ncbi:hypothetical protein [Streptomyces cinereoruber]
MVEVHNVTRLDAVWKHGDVVLDAEGNIRVRSDHPQWVWDTPGSEHTRNGYGGAYAPSGGLEEEDVVRPLILLVRDGQAVGGRAIEA